MREEPLSCGQLSTGLALTHTQKGKEQKNLTCSHIKHRHNWFTSCYFCTNSTVKHVIVRKNGNCHNVTKHPSQSRRPCAQVEPNLLTEGSAATATLRAAQHTAPAAHADAQPDVLMALSGVQVFQAAQRGSWTSSKHHCADKCF